MDYDRKSTVSSFYGGPRSSEDVLNRDYIAPAPSNGPRSRRDSSSSFFRPTSPATPQRSAEGHARMPSAGYNRMSFFDAGREEPVKGGYDEAEQPNEGSWDIYADFNNAGPRYSRAFGLGHQETSYQQLTPPPLSGKLDEESGAQGPVEMVTVPALGAEWGKDELKGMTKSARREEKAENFGRKWKAFNRGEYGLCGSKWLTRRSLVFLIFGICAAIGLILAFVIPRVPSFAVNGSTPLVSATGWFNDSIPAQFSRFPANFTFPADISLQVDTNSNFLPVTFNHLDAQVYDLNSFHLVGTGHMNRTKLPANTFTNIQMPLNFSYVATNDSDLTWINWYNACKSRIQFNNGTRPGLQFRINIVMSIAGLPTDHSTATTITNAPCPIELPVNAG